MLPIVSWLPVLILLLTPAILPAADGMNTVEVSAQNMVFEPLKPLIEAISTNPWIQGGLLILITFSIASLLSWLLFRLLRGLASRTSHQLDNHLVRLLQPPVTYTLIALGITAGLQLMPLPELWNLILTRMIRTINVI
ncbi:MAG: hypothetical protein IH612_03495, partial [Desulfofustis sp.]|nr:hypothetical protein [Desulfofustis sp.]